MHARDLRKHGETWQRLNSLSTWREVSFYDERERAALAWAECSARLADQHTATRTRPRGAEELQRPGDRRAELDRCHHQCMESPVDRHAHAAFEPSRWNKRKAPAS